MLADQQNQKTILHVDINSYFATLLQQENPALRNRPIGVVKDEGRTCLIAVSKEAKKFGLKTGSLLAKSLAVCPDLITVPAHFSLFLSATRKLNKIFFSISPQVYLFSLDEAFVDISDCRKNLYPDLRKLGAKVQDLIKQELGSWVTCNIGIAHNRFLAKLASETASKGSVTLVDATVKEKLIATSSFYDVCGVGYRLSKKLARLGVHKLADINNLDDQALSVIFGPFWSQELRKMSRGEEPHLLRLIDRGPQKMKSVSRSITGYRTYDNDQEIKSIIHNLCLEVVDKMRKLELAGRRISLALIGQKQSWHDHITMNTPIIHLHDLVNWINKLYSNWSHDFKVIKFIVRVSLLDDQQAMLLPTWQKNEKTQTAIDKLNNRYGFGVITPGSVNKANLIRPEVTGFFGDRDFQMKFG